MHRNGLNYQHWITAFTFAAWLGATGFAEEGSKRPIDGIMDNSFFIEEAYNQEEGVVQHILTGLYSWENFSGKGGRRTDLNFTQEWPAYGQAHQLSYSIPYAFERENGHWSDGVGDVLLNYRYQAYFDEQTLRAFAPRFSIILPTGDEDKGFGNGTVGYQLNLPYSMTFGDHWFVHVNAGLTFLPSAGPAPRHDLLSFNSGASAIYCATEDLNFLVEWIGNWNETAAETSGVQREFGSFISPGIRYAINLKSGAQIVTGLAAPVGLTANVPAIGAFIYFSFEHQLWGKRKD
jgi:hypothetical protein